MPIATIYCLLFGAHVKLHKRLLVSLLRGLPKDVARVVIWCNQVGQPTVDYITTLGSSVEVVFCTENMPKYKVMRRLFTGEHVGIPAPTTEWVVWFDDDSHITTDIWWHRTLAFIKKKKNDNICYIGQPWYVHYLDGQWDFVKESEWFDGRPAQKFPTKGRARKPGVRFVQGAYWWLRTDVLQQLDWPDPRLNHNGGDTLLGEAIRQQNLPLHDFQFGVKINNGKRRGYSEAPAGAKNKKARK
jgi:hypothetical protein